VHAPIIGVASPDLVGPDPPTDPRTLASYTWFEEIGTHEGTNWLAGKGVRPASGVVTAPGNLALDAARAGEGVTIVARIAVEADLAAGRLVELFRGEEDKGYWLVTRPGVQRSALRSFVTWLRREARATN
jgi:LysR family glycine cleavage system transcriptional activator